MPNVGLAHSCTFLRSKSEVSEIENLSKMVKPEGESRAGIK